MANTLGFAGATAMAVHEFQAEHHGSAIAIAALGLSLMPLTAILAGGIRRDLLKFPGMPTKPPQNSLRDPKP